jgi:hypothetical protein
MPVSRQEPPIRASHNTTFTICTLGYTKTVRPTFEVSNDLKHQAMQRYHSTGSIHDYELDHLIPLELGGCPDCLTNLWPQRWTAPGSHEKDDAEFFLRNQVCSGRLDLATAQSRIAHDWYSVYRSMPQHKGRRLAPSGPLLPGANTMPRIYPLEETLYIVTNTLRRAFPRTRFRLNRSGYADLDVHWIDGPNTIQVQTICHSFEGASLLGLSPMKFRSPAVEYNGQPALFQVDNINTCRHHSRHLLTSAALFVATECNLPKLEITGNRRILGGSHPVPYRYDPLTNTFTFTKDGGEHYSALILQAAQGLSCAAPVPVLLPTRSNDQQEVAL